MFAVWQRMAKLGDAAAQNNLGAVYREGKLVPRDYKQSIRWFTVAAKQGYPTAQFNLGVMFARGLGVARDRVTALKWFKLAAEQGNVNAQFNLAQAYAKGAGTSLDLEAALRWYSTAAKQGDKVALKNYQLIKAYKAKTFPKKNVEQTASVKAAPVQSEKKKIVPVIAKLDRLQLPQKTLVIHTTSGPTAR